MLPHRNTGNSDPQTESGFTVRALQPGDDVSSPAPSPSRRRDSSTLRLVLLLFVCAVIAAVGNAFLFRDWWISKTPTAMLLSFEGFLGSSVHEELLSRLRAGYLEAGHAQSVLARHGVKCALEFESPHPADIPIQARLVFQTTLPAKTWQCDFESVAWTLDGAPIDAVEGGESAQGASPDDRKQHTISIGPLDEGSHRVAISGKVSFTRSDEHEPRGRVYTYEYRASKDVLVRGFLKDYVQTSATDEEVEAVDANLAASAFFVKQQRQFRLAILERPVPVPIVASVWVRTDRFRQFRCIGTFQSAAHRGTTVFRAAMLELRDLPDLKIGGRIDVRMVPDWEWVFNHRVNRCFGAVIDWEGLPIFGQTMLNSNGGPMGRPRAPTRIDRDYSNRFPGSDPDDDIIL